MTSIILEVCGDHWLNTQQVQQTLCALPSGPIELDLRSEGPSLTTLGVIELFQKQDIDPTRVSVTRFSNSVEELPWRRAESHDMSHFFWLSKRYWCDPIPGNGDFLFGFFVGRKTIPRCRQIYDIYTEMNDRVLLSLMDSRTTDFPRKSTGYNLDSWREWGDADLIATWFSACPVSSLDHMAVHHQYDPAFNTNKSLLSHYHRFSIEIVSETYCRGDCFFPTEKTVRPVMSQKPMLIYGPRHYLKRLKNLGFETWDHLWDEGYDDLEGLQRWQEIKKIMRSISQHDAARGQDTCRHNRNVLEKIIKEHGPQ